jgi:hypothetical protein
VLGARIPELAQVPSPTALRPIGVRVLDPERIPPLSAVRPVSAGVVELGLVLLLRAVGLVRVMGEVDVVNASVELGRRSPVLLRLPPAEVIDAKERTRRSSATTDGSG